MELLALEKLSDLLKLNHQNKGGTALSFLDYFIIKIWLIRQIMNAPAIGMAR